MDRRNFFEILLGRLLALAGAYPLASHVTGSAGWAALSEVQSGAPSKEESIAGVAAGMIKYPAPGATLVGYLAKPLDDDPHPAVLLIHANSGLDNHIREVACRYAGDGFVALAVDQLARQGGTASFATSGAALVALTAINHDEIITDFHAARAYLRSHPAVRGNTPIQMVCAGSTPSIHRY